MANAFSNRFTVSETIRSRRANGNLRPTRTFSVCSKYKCHPIKDNFEVFTEVTMKDGVTLTISTERVASVSVKHGSLLSAP
jgi:hypothetical protein